MELIQFDDRQGRLVEDENWDVINNKLHGQWSTLESATELKNQSGNENRRNQSLLAPEECSQWEGQFGEFPLEQEDYPFEENNFEEEPCYSILQMKQTEKHQQEREGYPKTNGIVSLPRQEIKLIDDVLVPESTKVKIKCLKNEVDHIFKVFKSKKGRKKKCTDLTNIFKHFWQRIKPKFKQMILHMVEPREYEDIQSIFSISDNSKKQSQKWMIKLMSNVRFVQKILQILLQESFNQIIDQIGSKYKEKYRQNRIPIAAMVIQGLNWSEFGKFRNYYHSYWVGAET